MNTVKYMALSVIRLILVLAALALLLARHQEANSNVPSAQFKVMKPDGKLSGPATTVYRGENFKAA